MKTVVVDPADALVLPRSRAGDYLELTKPRIAVLVLFTVAAGYGLGCQGDWDFVTLLHTVFGTALVAAGASVLNQYLERHSDALMRRTEGRPLPSGRLLPVEALALGLALGMGGLAYLGVLVHQPLTVVVAAVTFVSYVWVYTPLKRLTTLNTLVGAVPGALPPVIGWTASGTPLTVEAAAVFLILFLWQVPHFLAIAWLYREDYGRAGLRMLPVVDPSGELTGRQMILYCACLLLVSALPALWGFVSPLYLAGLALVGGWFFWTTVRFARRPVNPTARLVLRASLVYLPVVLALLLLCGRGEF